MSSQGFGSTSCWRKREIGVTRMAEATSGMRVECSCYLYVDIVLDKQRFEQMAETNSYFLMKSPSFTCYCGCYKSSMTQHLTPCELVCYSILRSRRLFSINSILYECRHRPTPRSRSPGASYSQTLGPKANPYNALCP